VEAEPAEAGPAEAGPAEAGPVEAAPKAMALMIRAPGLAEAAPKAMTLMVRAPGLAGAGLPGWAVRATRAGGTTPGAVAGQTARLAPSPGPVPATWAAWSAPTAGTGRPSAWAAQPGRAVAGRPVRAAGAGPAGSGPAGSGPAGSGLGRPERGGSPGCQRRMGRPRGRQAGSAGLRPGRDRPVTVRAQRRDRSPGETVQADRCAIACPCPPGHRRQTRNVTHPGTADHTGTYSFNRNS
jgi:hypothetical protein